MMSDEGRIDEQAWVKNEMKGKNEEKKMTELEVAS